MGESTKAKMRDTAFANTSTAPNFVVIIAVDKISGKKKEICTMAPFVSGALDRNTETLRNQDLHSTIFYFDTRAALENIGFDSYTVNELLVYGKNKAVRDLIAKALKSTDPFELNFQGTRKQQFMLTHILFNNGIMSTSGDIAGNFMLLMKMK